MQPNTATSTRKEQRMFTSTSHAVTLAKVQGHATLRDTAAQGHHGSSPHHDTAPQRSGLKSTRTESRHSALQNKRGVCPRRLKDCSFQKENEITQMLRNTREDTPMGHAITHKDS
ncbi:hypothetical protein H920_15950 [Fukomys damarensis]|uniref:Uncharacterized protein n=1 Tax=Fukomys damarensis TaxID=885580 RepID=A0A091CVP8_FUKDA|nr:hypothetical protein H920_15950 [Fukomys damarensis]